MDVQLGQIVCSKMGRDKGKYFIVVEIIDKEYVYLVDGNIRKISKPKKKKIKHLILTDEIVTLIAEKIRDGRKFNDFEIRKCLSEASKVC